MFATSIGAEEPVVEAIEESIETPDAPEVDPLVEQRLVPAFLAAQDLELQPSDSLELWLDRDLEALTDALESAPALRVMITNQADADAGCLPGWRLYLSRGLVARMEHFEELRAALALALTACDHADRTWAGRSGGELPEAGSGGALDERFRDFRVETGYALFPMLAATPCRVEGGCREQAAEWLGRTGYRVTALQALLHRVESEWPDASVIERFGSGNRRFLGPDLSDPFVGGLEAIHEEREAMDHLRRARRDLLNGDNLQALRGVRRARETTHNPWLVAMVAMEAHLAGLQPESALRELEGLLAHRPDFPLESYYRGIALMQLGEEEESRAELEDSLELLPRISTHYTLGLLHESAGRTELAARHFGQAATGDDSHPQARGARFRVQQTAP